MPRPSPKKAATKRDAKPAAKPASAPKAEPVAAEPGAAASGAWLDAGGGYALTLRDGKLVCRNAKGARLGEARALVESYLETRFTREMAIQDEFTVEFEGGWMFFYNSALFVRTRDRKHALFGNAPIIVNNEGRLTVTGTSHRSSEFLEAYVALGPDRFEAGDWKDWIAKRRGGPVR